MIAGVFFFYFNSLSRRSGTKASPLLMKKSFFLAGLGCIPYEKRLACEDVRWLQLQASFTKMKSILPPITMIIQVILLSSVSAQSRPCKQSPR